MHYKARGRRIVVHSWSGILCVSRNAWAARRPRVGRVSAAVRRPQCVDGASAAMRPTMYRPLHIVLLLYAIVQISARFAVQFSINVMF